MLFIYAPVKLIKNLKSLQKYLQKKTKQKKKTGKIDGGIRIKEKYGSQIYKGKVRVSQGSMFHLILYSGYMWPANSRLGFPAAEAIDLIDLICRETWSSITGIQMLLREKVVTAFGSWCQIHNRISIFSGHQDYVMDSEVRIEQNLKSRQSLSLEPPCFSFHYLLFRAGCHPLPHPTDL